MGAAWAALALGWTLSSPMAATQPIVDESAAAPSNAQDQNFVYKFRESCLPYGKVNVVIAPDGLADAIRWVASSGYMITFASGEDEQGGYSAVIEVPEGGELDAFEALRNLKWAKASINNAFCPRGPEQAILSFNRQLFHGLADKAKLGSLLSQALAKALPKIPQPAGSLRTEGRGLHYTTTLEAPAVYFGIRDYQGWWLKVNLSFRVAHLGTSSDPSDEIDISFDDGWLAKYPAGAKPPKGYGYHLDPEGSDKFSDFTVLYKTQGIVADRIGKVLRADSVSYP